MLAKHCLEEFKLDYQLRRLTDRTTKRYYSNTLKFLIYVEKHHGITEVEEIYDLHSNLCDPKYLSIHSHLTVLHIHRQLLSHQRL